MEILLVEDDQDLAELIMEYLELEDMHCENAVTGELALKLARHSSGVEYDCIILDLNLPMLDGISVCRILRKDGCAIPIIMLTARSDIEDKLDGFSSGADDYLCKPFEMRELVARIKAINKRHSHSQIIEYGNLVMDLNRKIVLLGGINIPLSNIEWKILHILLSNSPNPVTKSRMIQEVWGDNPPETNCLKVHIHNLRKTIDFYSESPLIQTVPGIGYALYKV